MRRFLALTVSAAIIGTAASPAGAEWRGRGGYEHHGGYEHRGYGGGYHEHHGGGGWVPGAILGLGALGLGGALLYSQRPPVYYPPPQAYYPPPPVYYGQPQYHAPPGYYAQPGY